MRVSPAAALLAGMTLAACNTSETASPAAAPAAGNPGVVVATAPGNGAKLAENQRVLPGMSGSANDPFAGQIETVVHAVWKPRLTTAPSAVEQVMEPPAALQAMGLPPVPRRYNYTLAPGQVYEAELPVEVRSGRVMLAVSLVAPVHAEPEKGPLISVDGAQLAFQIPTPPREGVTSAVQVVVRSGSGWQSLNMASLGARGGSVRSGMLSLWLHFHPETKSFDIYSPTHMLLREKVPFEPARTERPIMAVRTMDAAAPLVVNNLTTVTVPNDLSQVQRFGTPGRRGGALAPAPRAGSRGTP
jgi:hypothetical protein